MKEILIASAAILWTLVEHNLMLQFLLFTEHLHFNFLTQSRMHAGFLVSFDCCKGLRDGSRGWSDAHSEPFELHQDLCIIDLHNLKDVRTNLDADWTAPSPPTYQIWLWAPTFKWSNKYKHVLIHIKFINLIRWAEVYKSETNAHGMFGTSFSISSITSFLQPKLYQVFY